MTEYDQAINAQIAAKNRGEDRAARDYIIIAFAVAFAIPGFALFLLVG